MVINAVGELKGTITAPARLVGTIEQIEGLKGIIDISPDRVSYGSLKAVISNSVALTGRINSINKLQGVISVLEPVDSYKGDYIITPKVESQSIKTKNKKMEDNVTVLAIPYYETSNPTGKTVYIGGE